MTKNRNRVRDREILISQLLHLKVVGSSTQGPETRRTMPPVGAGKQPAKAASSAEALQKEAEATLAALQGQRKPQQSQGAGSSTESLGKLADDATKKLSETAKVTFSAKISTPTGVNADASKARAQSAPKERPAAKGAAAALPSKLGGSKPAVLERRPTAAWAPNTIIEPPPPLTQEQLEAMEEPVCS